MFETLIETRRDMGPGWRPRALVVAGAVHAVALAVVLIQHYFEVPPITEAPIQVTFARFAPPPPPPPPPPAAAPVAKATPPPHLVEPTKVPEVVAPTPPPPVDVPQAGDGGVPGGVEGGVPGGVADAVPQPTGPLPIGGDVSAPVEIERVSPVYPPLARAAGSQGVVVLMAVIRRDGTVGDVKVVRGLGMGLSEAAVEAVRQWRYKPALQNGVPVDVYMSVAVQFRLS